MLTDKIYLLFLFSMPLQVYAIEVDITETISNLLARAGEALTLDLANHRVTVLGDRQVGVNFFSYCSFGRLDLTEQRSCFPFFH